MFISFFLDSIVFFLVYPLDSHGVEGAIKFGREDFVKSHNNEIRRAVMSTALAHLTENRAAYST